MGQRSAKKINLSTLPERDLLSIRLCDLGVRIKGTPVEEHKNQLHRELRDRGLRFRPFFWISDEWFSPEGIPGIAIPFFLLHPRLRRLELKHFFSVEGGERARCLKILRHETGHAIESAYKLSSRRRWRKLFGNPNRPYPESYTPRPFSQNYVSHLDPWYAQAHPVEDFAETFAVWLRRGSRWKARYREGGARRKLDYMDELMQEVADTAPRVLLREAVDDIRDIHTTVGEYIQAKRHKYGVGEESFYESELRRLFSQSPEHRKRPLASAFLRRHRSFLRETISRWTGVHRYTIDLVLDEMICRCRELKLHVPLGERAAVHETLAMLSVQMTHHLTMGHYRLSL